MDLPLLRQTEEFPFTAAFFAAVVMAVHVLPSLVDARGIPDHLGIRAHKDVVAPAFQLFAF